MLSRLKFKIEPLVNEMLDQIPQDVLIYGKVLDPAMGGGQFVKEVERRKRAAGLTDEQIKATTFGIERNILCRNYAVNKNKLVGTYDIGNFLEMENEMKFDVIVGNPPYQSVKGTGTQPLWPLFVNKAYQELSESGYMALVTPNKWCGHTANVIKGGIHLYKDLFKGKMVACNIQECSKYFLKVGGYENCFSYYIITNSGSPTFTATTLSGVYQIDKEQFEHLPLNNLTVHTANIIKKITTKKSFKFKQVSTGFTNQNNGSVVISMAQRLHYNKLNIYYDKGATYQATSKSTVSAVKFDDSSQEKIDKVFRSNLFKFIHLIFWNNDNFGTSFYNSLPFMDLNQLWTDTEIYDHFNLTQEEIDYIESTIK